MCKRSLVLHEHNTITPVKENFHGAPLSRILVHGGTELRVARRKVALMGALDTITGARAAATGPLA